MFFSNRLSIRAYCLVVEGVCGR